ncbi:MAG: hypothetical protein IIA67_10905 [Planctomycetes bacterium]|nr:hypothetical protein [Planctomycetota bacterium]
MPRIILTLVIVVTCFLIGGPPAASAQQPRRSYSPYRPSRPTVSPYLDLLRRRTGELDNYHTFVRPKQQTRAALRQQAGQFGSLQRQFGGLQRQFSSLQNTRVSPTGIGGGFMNHSHFYRIQPAGRRRR